MEKKRMATVVKKNRRSQDEIRRSLGLSSGGGGTAKIASTGTVRPASGTGAAPAGWYGDDNHDARAAAIGLGSVPNASQIKGMPSNPISFNGPSQAVTQGIGNATVGQSPAADATQVAARNAASDVRAKYNPFDEVFQRRRFSTGADTDEYYDLMKETEENRPDPFKSRYEGAIQTILDGILNPNNNKFDLNNDANYQTLYNQYAQQYQNQASRGMRDTMGAMQAATGGYGSTAATAAAGQAYDRAMEGLNDRNLQLMQMAYQMYGDEKTNRYNQLGAVTGLDNTDYARYRDTVGDWMADRNYYAGQYQNMYGNDWNQYAFDTNMDWNEYTDRANRAWQEFEYGDQRDYQRERDALSDYDNAFNMALKMANAGQQVPSHYASMLDPADVAQLNALAAQMAAEQLAGGSGGGGGGRGGRGGSKKSSGTNTDVVTGQPFGSRLGYTVNRNMVAQAVNAQKSDSAKYSTIEDAVASGTITPEQGLELIRSAGLAVNTDRLAMNLNTPIENVDPASINAFTTPVKGNWATEFSPIRQDMRRRR